MDVKLPTDASIILTYRCPMKCQMCNIWQHPTDSREEIKAADLTTLPKLKFINLTGGEPFIREDLPEIVEECYRHTGRIVISTSGWYEDKVIALAKRFPKIGIRISIEGLSRKNDELRGRDGGFDKGLRTLLTLKRMGLRDIGFGCTVSNHNSADMLALYNLSCSLGLEFATAAFHNSYYFHKDDNAISNKSEVIGNFEQLITMQLKEKHPKSWFRAFFNMGLINYIEGGRRMLPCEAGTANFFIDPWGEVYPCNGLESKYWKESMGNIRKASFDGIWHSDRARKVRELVRTCPKNCWMVGTASPVMKKYIMYPAMWALKNKLRVARGLQPCLDKRWYDVGQDKRQGDLRPGNQEDVKKMKIVVTGTRGIPGILGGVETHCEELYPRMAALGHDVTVIRRSCYVAGNAFNGEYRGVRLVDVFAPRRKSIEAIVHTFLAVIKARTLNPDMLHIHAIGPSLMVPFARLLGMKVVTTNHGPDYDRQKWGRLAKTVLKAGERAGAMFSNRVIVISKVIADILANKYGRRDTCLIFNGVNRPVKSSATDFLKRHDIIPGRYVLAIGRFVKEKGFHDLIEAFAPLRRRGWQLVIAGDADHEDDYSRSLKRRAAEAGVILTGFIKGEPLNQIMTNAALFVLPSYHEGLPISLLEAMSYNLDVAVSDIPANRLDTLEASDFFPAGDTTALTALITDKLDRGLRSRTYDLTPYDWDHITRQTLDLYREVIGK